MTDEPIDILDKSRSVVTATVTSAELPWAIDAYTNGKSFFIDEDTVARMAQVLPERLHKSRKGWREIVDGKPRSLAERHIHGRIYFKFRKYWHLHLVQAD